MKVTSKSYRPTGAARLTTIAAAILTLTALSSHSAEAKGWHKWIPIPGQPIACTQELDKCKFQMLRSPAVVSNKAFPNCDIGANGKAASARVKIKSEGTVEVMEVVVDNLPPKTDFDFFVIQAPNGPFGMSWYQGDIETDEYGHGSEKFIGRFNLETFIVAPGAVPAPLVHHNPPNPDATTNPITGPIHTFHLGLWFNSPEDAGKAGCPTTVTPFNGDHNAGIQILNTSQFRQNGPLFFVKP